MKAHFDALARYNAWANRRLYAAAARLSEADLKRDLGAAFRSVHGTLNHLLVADVIWLARMRGQSPPPWRLDHVAHGPLPDLAAAREALDDDLAGFVSELTEGDLGRDIVYRTVSNPTEMRQSLGSALAHLFNHHAHHRGQAHALLTRLTGEAPALDLLFFQRETA